MMCAPFTDTLLGLAYPQKFAPRAELKSLGPLPTSGITRAGRASAASVVSTDRRPLHAGSFCIGVEPRSNWGAYQYRCGREYWENLIALTGGNVSRVAKMAGVHRSGVYKTMARYHVQIARSSPGATLHRGNWEAPLPPRT